MRIMFLVGSYWPAQDGVAHVTQYIAEGLAKKNEVCVVAPFGKSELSIEKHNGVNIERIHARRICACQFVGEKRKALQRIKEYQPDVLIAVEIQNWGFDWTKRRLYKLPGKKVLMTHGGSCLRREGNVLKKIKEVRFHRQILADWLAVYIELYWKRYKERLPQYVEKYDLTTYLFDKEPLYLYMQSKGCTHACILENAVDNVFFERKAYLVDRQKPIVFINVSSYEEVKNQKLILNAFYKADIPDARLILIGSRKNEYWESLVKQNEKLAEKTHLCQKANVYVGISRTEVLSLYQQADVYLAASKIEGMSVSICEAAAAGLTIISTNVGHVAEIPGAYLYENENELVEIMRKVNDEPEIRQRCGEKAYDYASENDRYKVQGKVDYFEAELLKLIAMK